MSDGIEPRIRALFDDVGAVACCLAFAREVAAGRIDPEERANVPAGLRVGGAGTAGCRDPVQMSLRHLALFMMTMSDNAATDVVHRRTGSAAVASVLHDLGLAHTHVRGDMMWGHTRAAAELGLRSLVDLDEQVERADDSRVWSLAWMDPSRSNASTPAEIARLLSAIWTDRAGPPEACAFVRAAMARQLTAHRLAAGFDFPRADSLSPRRPRIDAAIGTAARLAIDHIRRAD